MNDYQFRRVERDLKKRYGKCEDEEMELYSQIVYPIERNCMRIHRREKAATSRAMHDALLLCLHRMKDHIDDTHTDTSSFEKEGAMLLLHGIMVSIDPYDPVWEGKYDDAVTNKSTYIVLSRILLRLLESVDLWNEVYGTEGYFFFLEDFLGKKVKPGDDEWDCCFLTTNEALKEAIMTGKIVPSNV
ncbi:MAG: hypothetical protein IJ708_07465 [Clostridia bacterium]|nr:hypothetical protein [Clostridia bacterium]MBR2287392.1 hypothetical protein [Clostridia bacterium]